VTDTPPPDWTSAYYREQYANSVRPMPTEECSRAEVDFLLRKTGERPGAAIADAPCGLTTKARGRFSSSGLPLRCERYEANAE